MENFAILNKAMIQRYIAILVFLTSGACKAPDVKNNLPSLVKIITIDSALVEESEFYMNGVLTVKLVGDSLIGVSSYKTPSVGFYHISGKQRKRIASGDYPVGSFSPSYFDASEYPNVYILDGKSESILVFDVEKQELIEKIKLELPEGKTITLIDAYFKKLKDSFLVQLTSSNYDNLNPEFYRESGDLIYFFDANGKEINNSFLTYPDVIKNIEVSIGPINYLTSTTNGESSYFTFPHEEILKHYSLTNSIESLEEIDLPKSRFFNYQINSADKVYSFEEIRSSGQLSSMKIPNSHSFSSIHETSTKLIIQTWMINDEIKGPKRTSHLLVFDKKERKWSESVSPQSVFDIGKLAGVVNDTLYFFEGSMMKNNEKYIKRAILEKI